ncbi:MAG: DUF3093 family protein [Acidobacteriota bacterium]|nr:DUF3093 family protein [Acidobacteriota bacterium]
MPEPISRYRAPTHYLWAGITASGLTLLSTWIALTWGRPWAWAAVALALASALLVLYLGLQPVVEIHEKHLKIGRKTIPWNHVRRLDRSSAAPLIVRLTLTDKRRQLLIYAGDHDAAASLLRHLRRFAREALIDGVPYRQFWGEPPVPIAPPVESRKPALRAPLLLSEDEAEIERMFQRLKTVGHLDQKTSSEDK